MGRIGLAFRVFFLALSGKFTAEQVGAAIEVVETSTTASDATQASDDGDQPQGKQPKTASRKEASRKGAQRSEALTLLATLQREARLVDLIQESLADYSDAQVGAAARDVLRDSRTVLDRVFSLVPVLDEAEDADVETPAQFSNAKFRLSGSVQGQPPYRGKLIHPGWQASRCEIPKWTGSGGEQWVIAPAEVEVKS